MPHDRVDMDNMKDDSQAFLTNNLRFKGFGMLTNVRLGLFQCDLKMVLTHYQI